MISYITSKQATYVCSVVATYPKLAIESDDNNSGLVLDEEAEARRPASLVVVEEMRSLIVDVSSFGVSSKPKSYITII